MSKVTRKRKRSIKGVYKHYKYALLLSILPIWGCNTIVSCEQLVEPIRSTQKVLLFSTKGYANITRAMHIEQELDRIKESSDAFFEAYKKNEIKNLDKSNSTFCKSLGNIQLPEEFDERVTLIAHEQEKFMQMSKSSLFKRIRVSQIDACEGQAKQLSDLFLRRTYDETVSGAIKISQKLYLKCLNQF